MFWNKKPDRIDSEEYLKLFPMIKEGQLNLQDIQRQLDFVKLQMKDLKTLVSRRLKLEEVEEIKSEKNKNPGMFLDSNGNPL